MYCVKLVQKCNIAWTMLHGDTFFNSMVLIHNEVFSPHKKQSHLIKLYHAAVNIRII